MIRVCQNSEIAPQVRKHGEAVKFTASVLGVSHECDLAILGVEDDSFWEDLEPLELGSVRIRAFTPHTTRHIKTGMGTRESCIEHPG